MQKTVSILLLVMVVICIADNPIYAKKRSRPHRDDGNDKVDPFLQISDTLGACQGDTCRYLCCQNPGGSHISCCPGPGHCCHTSGAAWCCGKTGRCSTTEDIGCGCVNDPNYYCPKNHDCCAGNLCCPVGHCRGTGGCIP